MTGPVANTDLLILGAMLVGIVVGLVGDWVVDVRARRRGRK